MQIKQWLKKATQKLEQAGIGTARLDALVLLEDVTGIDRAKLLAEPDTEISSGQLSELKKLLNQRAHHIPLAYVRGKTEFYGREFIVTPAVLEPRPESETMIDLLKGLPLFERASNTSKGRLVNKSGLAKKWRIADVGCGSGALGITAALELPNTVVELLDIDQNALKLAEMNVDKFTLNISVIKSDLLAIAINGYDILLCNLPYVPDSYQINRAAAHEPSLAIFGGPDGMDVYRRLFQQINKLKFKPLYILCEVMPPQHTKLETIATQDGYELHQTNDFIQVFEYPDLRALLTPK